jgi:hypothetical protein
MIEVFYLVLTAISEETKSEQPTEALLSKNR